MSANRRRGSDYELEYNLIAPIYSFKPGCNLKQFLEEKEPNYFVPFIKNFPMYIVMETLIRVITEEKYYDEQNPWIIWCEGNELFSIFYEFAFHYLDLRTRLEQILEVKGSFPEAKVEFPHTESSCRFYFRVKDIEQIYPSWAGSENYINRAHDRNMYFYRKYKLMDLKNRMICTISDELFNFDPSIGRKRCFFCIKITMFKHLKRLPFTLYEYEPSYLYFTDDRFCKLFGNVKAMTKWDLPKFLYLHVEVVNEKDLPYECTKSFCYLFH